MSVAATGILSVPRDKLKSLLAELDSFQSWMGDAGKILYSLALDQDASDRFPFIVIQWRRFTMSMVAGGTSNSLWPHDPVLTVLFVDNDRGGVAIEEGGEVDPSKIMDGDVEFSNRLGALLEEMASLAAVDDRLAITNINLAAPPQRSPIQNWPVEAPYIWAAVEVTYD